MSSDHFTGKRLWIIMLILGLPLLFSLLGTGQDQALSEVDLNKAGIRETLRSLAKTGGFHILLDSTVQGNVSLKLKPGLSAKYAIELLAQMYGYRCRWEGRTAMVGNEPMGTGRGEEETRIYSLHHELTDRMLEALEVVVPAERITIDPTARQLTIKANALEDYNLREIIGKFDRESVSYLIEVKIAELDLNIVIENGLSWSLPASSTESSFRVSTLTAEPLAALVDKNLYRVLTDLQVYTEHGKEGSTSFGDQYPVITSKPGENMDLLEYKNVGIEIEVTPYTEEQEMITLALNLEVSGYADGEQAAGQQAPPVLNSNRLSSIRGLKNGESCVISGINFTGRNSSLVSSAEQAEGPAKEKVVCLFLTPRLVTEALKAELQARNVQATGPEDGSPVTGSMSSQSPATPEVIHIEIIGKGEEITGSDHSPGEVMTEVVGLVAQGEAQERQKDPTPAPEPREERIAIALRVAYRVSKGDTIFSIARKYGVDPELILAENQLGSSSLLSVGQTLQVPVLQNHLYELQPKETLWRIAQRYGTTVELLIEINSINDVTTLRTDQVIILPVPADRVVNDQY